MVCVCVYQYSNEQTAVSLVASRFGILILVVHVGRHGTNLPRPAARGARPLYTDSRLRFRSAWALARHPAWARTDTQKDTQDHGITLLSKLKK